MGTARLLRLARALRRLAWAAPLAVVYGVGVAVRRWAYDRNLLPRAAAPLRVISIGGLEAGGSGKTPLTGYVLAALVRRGVRSGLLTRGYGRGQRGLVLRRTATPAHVAEIGDEATMLVKAGLDVPVAACADRRRGAAALAASGCEVAVMDDGFAHRRLRRTLDVVVLRAEAPFGKGPHHVLPWGSLRESPRALRRADVVVFYGGVRDGASEGASGGAAWPDAATRDRLLRLLRPWAGPGRAIYDVDGDLEEAAGGPTPPGQGGASPLAVGWAWSRLQAPGAPAESDPTPQDPAASLSRRRVVAAAGIARPAKFFAALRAAGVEVLATRGFADHHAFTAADVAALRATAHRHGATQVAVTAKDAVKLAPLWPPGPPALVPCVLQLGARLPAVLRDFGPGA